MDESGGNYTLEGDVCGPSSGVGAHDWQREENRRTVSSVDDHNCQEDVAPAGRPTPRLRVERTKTRTVRERPKTLLLTHPPTSV